MRRPRVRFTVRRMMVAVAIMAVFFGAADGLRRRRESFGQQAKRFARKASDEYNASMSVGRHATFGPSPLEMRISQAHYQLADHYSALKEKYERAASAPWLPVEPDPAAPDWPNDLLDFRSLR
jgi:hypothetical protein